MKIEFRKAPLDGSEFEINSNSVKFLGTFCKISSKLAKISAKLNGNCDVDCCKCGVNMTVKVDESIDFLVSDGNYEPNEHNDDEFVIIEAQNHTIDFDDILHSEIESLKSEYYVCDTCKNNDNLVELEY
ncbi:MAG: hypothetical protein U9N59_04640 [Campylobacterota bacterium]|nr:hypothetical protein [Campylobacterota bacterium]